VDPRCCVERPRSFCKRGSAASSPRGPLTCLQIPSDVHCLSHRLLRSVHYNHMVVAAVAAGSAPGEVLRAVPTSSINSATLLNPAFETTVSSIMSTQNARVTKQAGGCSGPRSKRPEWNVNCRRRCIGSREREGSRGAQRREAEGLPDSLPDRGVLGRVRTGVCVCEQFASKIHGGGSTPHPTTEVAGRARTQPPPLPPPPPPVLAAGPTEVRPSRTPELNGRVIPLSREGAMIVARQKSAAPLRHKGWSRPAPRQ
jgi:hypothetical protein